MEMARGGDVFTLDWMLRNKDSEDFNQIIYRLELILRDTSLY